MAKAGFVIFAAILLPCLALAAAPFKEVSCQAFSDSYDPESMVSRAIYAYNQKNFPKIELSSGGPGSCISALRQTLPGKNNFVWKVKVKSECYPNDNIYEIYNPSSSYVCEDIHFRKVGDKIFDATVTQRCPSGTYGNDTYVCSKVTSLKDVTSSRKPFPPITDPKGKWIETPVAYVPKKVLNSTFNEAKKKLTITKARPIRDDPSVYSYPYRKYNADGSTSYKVKVSYATKSLAKGCSYPFLYEIGTVETKVSKDGKIAPLKYTPVEIARSGEVGPDAEEVPRCVYEKSAAWKKGNKEANEFIKKYGLKEKN